MTMDWLREIFGGFSGFKGRLLLFAGILVLSGVAWQGGREFLQSDYRLTPAKPGPVLAADWANGGSRHDALLRKVDRWGGVVFTVALSFFVAIVVGSILRAAFKTGMTLLFLSAAVIWFLENRGYAEFWHHYYETVQDGGTWLTVRLGVMRQFLAENLPSAGSALLGFGFGLRK